MQQHHSAASLVPVTAKQEADTAGPRAWPWVEAAVWTKRMLAALENGVTGGRWYSLMDKVYAPRTLEAAWKRVAANKGAAGVDRVSVQRFARHAQRYLAELARELRDGSYRPEPVRRVHIPKGQGRTRPLGIATVKDRIAQAAVKLVLEPIFEREFLPPNYGFRPERSSKDALREVEGLLKAGYGWVVDLDLENYFDSIPKGPLLARVAERVSDGPLLQLVQRFLDQDILDGLERWTPIAGTAQGSGLSPLLANLYLHPLDQLVSQAGYRIVRYADDALILCRTQAEAEAALALVKAWTEQNGLRLHPDKTQTVHYGEAEQGVEFLGYRFIAGYRAVRPKSLMALKDKIRQKTGRTRSGRLEDIIVELNPILRGWFGYFKHARHSTFRDLDSFVRRRLRAMLRKREKRPGFGLTHGDHRRWPNTFFAQHGLFTLHEAYVVARQSR
jgi:RNA-directed DNA polymerase